MTGSRGVTEVNGFTQLGHRQAHVVTYAQLRDLGISHDHVADQIAARRWSRVTRNVVVVHNGPHSPRTRLWMAVLAARPPVALGSWTGLALHGLRGWDRPDIHLAVRRGARPPNLSGVVIHASRKLDRVSVVTIRGLPVRHVERCAVDAASSQASSRTAVGVLAAAVQQRLTTAKRLRAELDSHPTIRFRALMLAALTDIAGGADALSEIDFLTFCRAYGFGAPEQQARRRDSRGRVRYLDALWTLADGRRLVVEIDGVGHMEVARWYDDLLRDAELCPNTDTITIRLPANAVRSEPQRVAAILAGYLTSRRGAPRTRA